jgi:hypothetical protein
MAKLNAAMRRALKPSQFALPDKKAYPIPDKSHAQNALSRASGNATPSEQATIATKVHDKFPDLKMGAGKRMMKKAGSK